MLDLYFDIKIFLCFKQQISQTANFIYLFVIIILNRLYNEYKTIGKKGKAI